MVISDPEFPPLLKGFDVRGDVQPFEEACSGAADGRFGAGDIVWSRSMSEAKLAIVLEPEVSLEKSVQMVPLAMVACGDCLGALTPPKVAVTFVWPGTLLVNGGIVGEVRGAVPGDNLSADDIPDWMVVGLTVRLKHDPNAPEPGYMPERTVLAEEGCPDLTRTAFINSYSRHFLTWINIWQDDGFRPVHDSWTFKAEGNGEEISLEFKGAHHEGVFLGLDENGNLLLKEQDGVTRSLRLSDAIELRPATQPVS